MAKCPEGMHTKDYLAQELRKVGLEEMAKKAEAGYYHDFLSPLALPEMQLAMDLAQAIKAEGDTPKAREIIKLRGRHFNGEFDANLKESEEWANSKEGLGVLDRLVSGK